MYKIIWSLVKSECIIVSDIGHDWTHIKGTIKKKINDIDASVLTNILVISTVGKDIEHITEDAKVKNLF
jgi:hypothetical protein